jgi:6-phosphofructokinase 1
MKIAVLTSGGDAPGMNACVRAVIRSTINYGYQAFGVFDGYKGLVEGKIKELNRNDVGQILNRGGTILGSSRLESFKEKTVRQVAVDNLKSLGINNLICIGGDGTFRGAMDLNEMGINCIAIPGTIDNDIPSTEFTIGFFTALDTAVDAIDKLRDTSFSHQRCTVVEVMGRNCGDLSIFSGIACGAEIVITKDTGYDEKTILEQVKKAEKMGKRHLIVVVAENITNVFELAKAIQDNSSYEARATVLGYIQRGGTPSSFDRILASKMGVHAVDLLIDGKGGYAVYTKSLDVGHIELEKSLITEIRPSDLYKYLAKLN